jgi:exodeoxyribonuclease-3
VTQQQLKLISWNVNGIRALEKKGFAQWLQGCGADIMMLQETKASPEQLSAALCKPDGFHAEWCAAQKKGYSGVATFSRTSATTARGLNHQRFDSEGRVLISTFADFTLLKMVKLGERHYGVSMSSTARGLRPPCSGTGGCST